MTEMSRALQYALCQKRGSHEANYGLSAYSAEDAARHGDESVGYSDGPRTWIVCVVCGTHYRVVTEYLTMAEVTHTVEKEGTAPK